MKVLLVNSISYYVKQKAAIPLGLLSLATCLTQKGHAVKVYDRAVEGGSVDRQIRSFAPDIVGVSSLGIKSFRDAEKVSRAAKKRNIPVVWGGHVPTLIPELVLKTGVADYVILGDGELSFPALLEAIEGGKPLRSVTSLAYLDHGSAVVNEAEEPADLARFPVIDFRFVDPSKYFWRHKGHERMLHIYSSKGCIGDCTYCYCPGYSKCRWRARPAEHCVEELKTLVEQYRIDGFYFVDDLFAPNKRRVIEMCDKLIESGLRLEWSCDMRTDICDGEILQKMYDAGCRWIFFGLESGSPERQRAIKKKLGYEKSKEVIDLCGKIGIWTTASFVIGFPDEGEEELRQTIKLINEVRADVKVAAVYGPMPGSEMFRSMVNAGMLQEPASYAEWEKLAIIDEVGNNYSRIPVLDLKVISNFYLFSNIAGPKDASGKENKKAVWFKRLGGLAVDILKRGNGRAFAVLLLSAKEFFEMAFYALMFPRTRKKYGLSYRVKPDNKN